MDCGPLERRFDCLEKRSFLAQYKAQRLCRREIFPSFGIVLQAPSVRFVCGERLKRNQSPRNVIGAFMRQEIADQMTAAARNDPAPIFGIFLEGSALKRVDPVANEASDVHGDAFLPAVEDNDRRLPTVDGSSNVEP